MNNPGPLIRFNAFKNPWSENKFKYLINVNSGRDYKHLNIGDIPVFGTGGFMCSVDKELSNEDAIGIGRKGTINKPFYLKAPFWTVDTLFFVTPKKDIDLNYLLSHFMNIEWLKYDESSGLPSLSKKTIENIVVKTPIYKEQIQIGKFFKELDALIELQQASITNLEDMRIGFLNKLHPSKDKFKPIIQVGKKPTKWTNEKLSSFCKISTGKLNANAAVEKGEYDFITCAKSLFKTNTWKFEGPAITVAGNGVVGFTQIINGKFDAYQRTYVLEKLKLDVHFLKNEIDTRISSEIHKSTNTSAMSYIVMDTLASLEIKIPGKEEDIKFLSKYFLELDKLIKLEIKELELLQEMKKGFLQKMFV